MLHSVYGAYLAREKYGIENEDIIYSTNLLLDLLHLDNFTLEETEAMRLQNSFADGVRGLQVDGVKTLRPDAVVKCVQA